MASYKIKYILRGHSAAINKIIQLENDDLASASSNKTIKVWTFWLNVNDWTCKYTLSGHTSSVYALVQMRNGYLASGSGDKTIKVWSLT